MDIVNKVFRFYLFCLDFIGYNLKRDYNSFILNVNILKILESIFFVIKDF